MYIFLHAAWSGSLVYSSYMATHTKKINKNKEAEERIKSYHNVIKVYYLYIKFSYEKVVAWWYMYININNGVVHIPRHIKKLFSKHQIRKKQLFGC